MCHYLSIRITYHPSGSPNLIVPPIKIGIYPSPHYALKKLENSLKYDMKVNGNVWLGPLKQQHCRSQDHKGSEERSEANNEQYSTVRAWQLVVQRPPALLQMHCNSTRELAQLPPICRTIYVLKEFAACPQVQFLYLKKKGLWVNQEPCIHRIKLNEFWRVLHWPIANTRTAIINRHVWYNVCRYKSQRPSLDMYKGPRLFWPNQTRIKNTKNNSNSNNKIKISTVPTKAKLQGIKLIHRRLRKTKSIGRVIVQRQTATVDGV